MTSDRLQIFKTIFISMVLEALPFILIGVFVSALMQVFVSEQSMRKWIPKNPVLAIIVASVIGIIFPICECGMVPVIRKLIKKGMPLYVAVVFILAGPILNPIVFLATFTAFRNRPDIVYARMGLTFVLALVIGLIIYHFVRKDQLKVDLPTDDHQHFHENKLTEIMTHTTSEFFEMGKFLLFGSLVAAGLQTFVARDSLAAIGDGWLSSHVVMMILAYLLSLCSTSDAFVASSFSSTFSAGALVTFLVFGPMLNLKGTIMLAGVFKTRFVLLLSVLVLVFSLAGSLLVERFFLS
ncbi:permease [Brevibacillus reuszeri]|uniref:permease n=1 Tax=Brevibacillus reuszeri TaxID=54915 RepID=UPI00289BAC5C|nr:permease [Brevibacillus reuszeri]